MCVLRKGLNVPIVVPALAKKRLKCWRWPTTGVKLTHLLLLTQSPPPATASQFKTEFTAPRKLLSSALWQTVAMCRGNTWGRLWQKRILCSTLTLSMWNMRSSSQTFSKHLSSVSTNTCNDADWDSQISHFSHKHTREIMSRLWFYLTA